MTTPSLTLFEIALLRFRPNGAAINQPRASDVEHESRIELLFQCTRRAFGEVFVDGGGEV